MLKTCCKCHQQKPFSQFSKRAAAKDGLMSACKQCEALRMAEWYDKNAERQRARALERYSERKPEIQAVQAAYRTKHRAEINAQIARYRKTPEGKRKKSEQDRRYASGNPAAVAEYGRRYRGKHPEKIAAHVQARRAARLQAVNNQDCEFLQLVSQEANRLAKLRGALTGFPWEVDHVIPLRGKTASGLHNPFNLQVIPRSENRRKSNRLQPSYHNAIVRAG